MFATSFTPKNTWFVFDVETGKTIERGFRSRASAQAWIGRKLAEAKAPVAQAA